MAIDDKYVMNGVWLTCDKGVTPSRFQVTPKPVQLYDEHFANELDKIPLVNILPFGGCSVTRTPCMPAPVLWERVMEEGLTVLGARPLLDTSKCQCGVGGQIAIHFTRAEATAAVALDQQLDQVDAVADAVEEASGWAFWGGLAMGIGGAVLVATGVGAPLGAALITGAGYLMTASTVAATAAAVTRGATKFARDPSKEVGLSIVGEVAFEAARNYVMNKLGGKLIGKLASSGLAKRVLNSPFARKMEDRFAHAFSRNRAPFRQKSCVNDPVDVATGNVVSLATDFELSGPLPLEWSRVWYATSAHNGILGNGWHHAYDEELFVDEELILLRLSDGRYTGSDALEVGESIFIRGEKLTLRRELHGVYTITDRQGLLHHLAYIEVTDSYKLVKLEDVSRQAAIEFDYSERGALCRILDSAGRVLKTTCDDRGRLESVQGPHPTEPRKLVTLVRYSYDRKGRLIRATDALSQAWQYDYQGSLMTECTYKNGTTFHYKYDGVDISARCIHVWGNGGFYEDRLQYNIEAHQTTVTNSVGARRVFEYDEESGVVTRLFDARGGLTVTEYNEYSELISETDPLGNKTRYEYDKWGNYTRTELPNGAQIERRYDENNKLVLLVDAVGGQWQWAYTEDGLIAQRVDPTNRVARYSYSNGRLSTITDQSTGQTTTFFYDVVGNLREVHTADGQCTRWLYDQWGRIHKSTDSRGNVQWREYDLLSRVIKVHEPDGNVRRFTYDALDNILEARDHHHQVQYAYRGLSCLIRRVEAGVAVEFLYDSEGQLRALVNEHGLTHRFELDAEGDVITETGFDGLTRSYLRDVGGRVIELNLPTGHRTCYSYDSNNQVTGVLYSDGNAETYHYREDGLLLEAINKVVAVRFKRDILGNILQERQGEYTVDSVYDAFGNRSTLSSSLGAHIRYGHDEQGAVSHMKMGNWQALFERDAQGLETQRTLSGGVRAHWKRDQLGRVVEQRILAGTNRQIERTRFHNWQETDRLTEIQDSEHGVVRFEYDNRGNLSNSVFGNEAVELRLADLVGNLYKTGGKKDRQYGPAGQLLKAGNSQYAYDNNGNLSRKYTTSSEEWNYVWNAAGQLAEVVRPDGGVVRFAYDALGRRIVKDYQGRLTRWLWDGNKLLHEWHEQETAASQDNQLITWLFEEDTFAPVGKIQGENAYSILTDHVGTPLQMHNANGQVTWSVELNSYGQIRRSKGDVTDCPFRYQGQYEDAETGLYYNRFRYYDAEAGCYISKDPIGLSGGNRLYGYVKDPNKLIDPSGLSCETTAKLQSHANSAKAEAALSPKQQASIQRSRTRASEAAKKAEPDPKVVAYHEMQAAKKERLYMGTQVDTRFKAKVDADPDLAHLNTTPRGKVGPDVYDPKEKKYWDLTTEKDWNKGTHQNKYDDDFGSGTGIFW